MIVLNRNSFHRDSVRFLFLSYLLVMINAIDFFDDYMKMVAKKYRLNKADKHRVENAELYLNGIEDELQEVREEIKKDNYVYLEDEL